ncbi:MAG TPA: CDP-alcohol phosphatidyltransferase family protein [Polyangiaceae bacterium]|nr:CDP-alcohol phosphatidyltransferase family protein [Polyangiaceae bacterium]
MLDLLLAATLVLLVVGARVFYALRVARTADAISRATEGQKTSLFGRGFVDAMAWAATPIARQLVADGVSANAVTGAALVFGAAGGMAFAAGHFGIGAWFAASSALCDALDGVVARLSGTASTAGETLDTSVDRYTEFFLLAGLGLYFRTNAWMLAVVLLALQGSFMVSYVETRAASASIAVARRWMAQPDRATLLIIGAVLSAVVAGVGAARWVVLVPILAALFIDSVGANASAAYRLIRLVVQLGKPAGVPASMQAPMESRTTSIPPIGVHRVHTIG